MEKVIERTFVMNDGSVRKEYIRMQNDSQEATRPTTHQAFTKYAPPPQTPQQPVNPTPQQKTEQPFYKPGDSTPQQQSSPTKQTTKTVIKTTIFYDPKTGQTVKTTTTEPTIKTTLVESPVKTAKTAKTEAPAKTPVNGPPLTTSSSNNSGKANESQTTDQQEAKPKENTLPKKDESSLQDLGSKDGFSPVKRDSKTNSLLNNVKASNTSAATKHQSPPKSSTPIHNSKTGADLKAKVSPQKGSFAFVSPPIIN